MEIIGITGGIGSGKSTVCDFLEKNYNAEIILADDVSHDVMEPGSYTYEALTEIFTEDYFMEDGSINRKEVGDLAFKDPEILYRMNDIIHPAVWDSIEEHIIDAEASGKDFAFIEAALLIEAGYRKICSEFWFVYADEDTRIKRLVSDRNITADKARDIMANQLSDIEFREACDFEINNNGSFEYAVSQIKEHITEKFGL